MRLLWFCVFVASTLFGVCGVAKAQAAAGGGTSSVAAGKAMSPEEFTIAAGPALQVMKKRAEELKAGGAAVLAYFEGDKIQGWTSRMLVVGHVKDPQTATDKGNNLLGIAYAKAAEMADTLRDSGSKVRPPMTGEFGWEGGVIVPYRSGYLVAAFSGGASADDVAVSKAGVAAMTGGDSK